MEFLDEESRPRFQFRAAPLSSSQTTPPESNPIKKLLICATTSVSLLIFVLTFLFASNLEPLTSILLWIAVSILVGPIAPIIITGGDIRVGNGEIVDVLQPDPVENEVKKVRNRGGGSRRQVEEKKTESTEAIEGKGVEKRDAIKRSGSAAAIAAEDVEEEREWTEEDFEMLKKQMVKNPVGKPRRWEVIAEAFQGRHKVENVVKMAKSMADRKVGNGDSYAQFLKNRKPIDSRAVESQNGGMVQDESKQEWSPGEDRALLTALKAFPKDVAMRWEKISAAVPGRSKNACVNRVAELTRDFRTSKAS